MAKKASKKPMYFSSLELENIKCFGEKQILDLKNEDGTISKWTLILGNNGLGKTTLLKCLAWMNTEEETDALKKKNAKIPKDMIAVKGGLDSLKSDGEYEQLSRIGRHVVSKVTATFAIGTVLGEKPKADDLLAYSTEIEVINGKLKEVYPKLTAVKKFHAPDIYGYNASRHMEVKNLDQTELIDPMFNLFSDSGELFDATEQLLYQDYAALQESPKGKETALLNKIKQLLSEILPGIETPDDILTFAKERSVKIKTKDGNVPINNMSLGYKTMIAWIVDLALKMLARNPESESPLDEPAIVIIDEVDLHLHPEWQRIIRQKLTETFTKTQFICTAHSPFMAQASQNENLCVLSRKGKDVFIENSPFIVRGWRIGQIVTSDLFGLSTDRGPDEEKILDDRRELIDKAYLSQDDQIELKKLTEKIDALPSGNAENDRILEQINKAAKLLQAKGIINDQN